MVEGRARYEWNHTSHLLAEIHNAQAMSAKDLVTAADRNPYARRERKGAPLDDPTTFRELGRLINLQQRQKR